MPRTIAVSLGTDFHQFDRLMDWLKAWHARNPDVELRIQHGYSKPFPGPVNREILPHSELLEWFEEADTLVLQGGPGGILDALKVGKIPIVVPRLAMLHEVVDDHQVAFCKRLSEGGFVRLAESSLSLFDALDNAQLGAPPRQLIGDGPAQVRRLLTEPPVPLPRPRTRTRLQEIWIRDRGGIKAPSVDGLEHPGGPELGGEIRLSG